MQVCVQIPKDSWKNGTWLGNATIHAAPEDLIGFLVQMDYNTAFNSKIRFYFFEQSPFHAPDTKSEQLLTLTSLAFACFLAIPFKGVWAQGLAT